MSTKWQPIQIPPGVVAEPTKNMRSSNWAEVNLVRWVEGELAPVGGQSQYAYTFASRCKAIHGWYDLQQTYHVAYVCEENVYVDTGGTLTEITPAGGWLGPTPTTQGGYGDGAYGQGVQLNAGAPFDGTSPNITMVANPGINSAGLDVFNVTTGQDVGTVLSYSGTALVLTANALSASQGANDLLNFGAYGEPRATTSVIPVDQIPPMWSVDNFGAILLVMSSIDGRLLEWDPAAAAGTLLTRTANSPHGRCFVVTQERFVMIFGQTQDGTVDQGSFRRFGWCNQGDRTAWDFSNVTSQSGFLDIEPSAPIITAHTGRFGTLFFTAKKAYISRYLGLPYVYNYLELADDCTPWSPASVTSTSSYVLWMSKQGVFSFDGTTITPVACLVRSWITDDVDLINVRQQACAVHVGDFNEFWWFYPQDGQPYNTRCVIFNYKEGWWSQGQMSRSAGITSSYSVQTVMADGLVAFQHELGDVYGNASPPWAETFDLNLTSGARLATLKQVIPDVDGDAGDVQFSFWAQMSRSLTGSNPGPGQGQATPAQWSAPQPIRSDGYVDARVTGRDIRMRISTPGPIILPFTVGQHLVDFALRGDR